MTSKETLDSLALDASSKNSQIALPTAFEDFRDFHKDQSIIVCGCGSSLKQLHEPEHFITIGVNDVGRLFNPDYLVVLNSRSQFTNDRFRYIEESKARAVFSHLPLKINHPHYVRFILGQRGGVEVDSPQRLPYTRNSPYVAVCLAIHMGAKRVGLMGVDFTQNHFFANTGRHKLNNEIKRIDAEYGRLAEASAKHGVEIVNLSSESALSRLNKCSVGEFAARAKSHKSLKIVSYATTPMAGVPQILSRCINERTPHQCRTVWATNSYGNGVKFEGDVEWNQQPAEARKLLAEADLVIAHNGRSLAAHDKYLKDKPVLTMAHNYMWNVCQKFVQQGYPGLVVGQYQASLPEFSGWQTVPNPIPLWNPDFSPGEKDSRIAIAYTPSGKHETYPHGHRLYWHSKGYKTTMAALQRLAQRYSINLHVIKNRQVSFAQSLSMKQRAHIVIDECATGSYHRNSLEGMAAGCVVVNGLGLVPAITDVFRHCSGDQEPPPFELAKLENIETSLADLIDQGAQALTLKGNQNRVWMQQHWDFEKQWQEFWLPAVQQAFERAGKPYRPIAPIVKAVTKSVSKEQIVNTSKDNINRLHPEEPGVSIIIPFGGKQRLPLLEAVLRRLKSCKGIDRTIVVEMDAEVHARSIGEELADDYIFTLWEQPFNKSRAMNIGIPFVRSSHFMWLDSDLVLPEDFVINAHQECIKRGLDCLIPWDSVFYLSKSNSQQVMAGERNVSDCKHEHHFRSRQGAQGAAVMVRTDFALQYGGMFEEFQGWGGEDNAWFYKVQLLGRINYTRDRHRNIHHLYHEKSSGYCKNGEHINANPNYANNFELLKRIRSMRTAATMLNAFPPSRHHSPPWLGQKRVCCPPSRKNIGAILENIYGEAIVLCSPGEDADITLKAEKKASTHDPIHTALQTIVKLTRASV